MAKSNRSASSRKDSIRKPVKPYSDFPLFPHATKRWAKKILGKLHYFGPWDDPDGALQKYLDQRDDLHAGRTPRVTGDGLKIRDLCNHFLTAKQQMLDSKEITNRTFQDYHRTCDRIIAMFGKTRFVNDLAADDFQRLRADIAKTSGPVALGNEVNRIRVVFKYGYDAALIDKPMRFGPMFKRPAKKVIRKARNESGPRMFEADQIRVMIDEAGIPLKAMIYLGVNCGFGNADVGQLPIDAIDLDKGWIVFPRGKTGITRRCPLWPETTEALQAAIQSRPEPKEAENAKLAFLTKYKQPWHTDRPSSPLSAEFRKFIKSIDEAAAMEAKEAGEDPPTKLYRKGLGFYALRHVFETIGGESRDQVAVDAIMGHADQSMAAVYRERISDDRLRAVVDHVRSWLFAGSDSENEGQREPRRLRVVG
jgi:integrase